MTMEQESTSVPPVTPQSPIVQGGEPVEVQAIVSLIQGIVEPIARSQEFAESEKTKRTQIEAGITSSFLRYSFRLATLILAISIAALFLGKDQLTEKIIFAVVGFLGGLAFGKGSQRGEK